MRINLSDHVTDKHALVIFALKAFLWTILVYGGDTVLLGGEGNFVFNWASHDSKYGGTYLAVGYGMPSLIPNVMGLETVIFNSLSGFEESLKLQSLLYLLVLFILPVISFYIYARTVLSATPAIALLASTLYVFNVFGLTYVQSMNIWNNLSLTTIPIFAAAIHAGRNDIRKAMFLVGSLAIILSFTLYNPPTLVISSFSVIVMLIPAMVRADSSRNKLDLRLHILRSNLIALAFLFFSAPWIIITILEIFNGTHDQIFTKSWAINWGQAVSGVSSLSLLQGVLGIIFSDPNQDIFNFLIPTMIFQIVLVSLLLYWALFGSSPQARLLSILMIFFGILTAGSSGPLGFIYRFMME